MSDIFPPIPKPFGSPFYYSSLTNVGVFYLVDSDPVANILKDKELQPASFDGKACVMFNFQNYTAQFPFGSSITQEIELQIIAVPNAWAQNAPQMSLQEFLLGGDQTKLLGNFRVWVPCDACVAILAGSEIFGEPKFAANFDTSLPSLNAPDVRKWDFSCYDQSDYQKCTDMGNLPSPCDIPGLPKSEERLICQCVVDVTGLSPAAGNYSPITEFGEREGRLIAARWNILRPFDTYFLDEQTSNRVTLRIGGSSHGMSRDMQLMIGDAQAAAVRTFLPAPDAIQSRPFYVQ